jgi:phosphomannomutase/phosphoglucomutase
MSVFKAYDIRGIYGKDLTNKIALKIGKALGTFLKGREEVCVGFDTRKGSKKITKSFCSGLASTGCNVTLLGLVATPILYFYAWKNRIFGSMITASHNPKEWTGFKFVKPNGSSFLDELQKLKEIFEKEDFLEGVGEISNKNPLPAYKNFIRKNLGKVEGRIGVECFGGAGVSGIEALEYLGLSIFPLHAESDENFFGFERPEPKGKNLKILKRIVRKEKLDFGVAFDGDADRSVFVDDRGNELNGSTISAIFIEEILKKRKGKVILTADCASELKKIAEKFGGELIWWRVGHGFIEKKCIEEKALFAGEQSSHFYFNYIYPFSDGILATAYLAKIISEKEEKLSEIVKKIKLHPTEKIYISVGNDEKKIKIIEKLKEEIPEAIDIMDGIKIELNEIEWVLIRASQTLPEINICAEGKNEERLKKIIGKYTKIVKKKMSELK